MRINKFKIFTRLLFLSAFSFGLTACGSGDAGEETPTSSGDPVADTLTNLGVTIDTSPRLGDDMQPLPEDYSPFGSGRSFEKFDELMMLGPVAKSSFNNDLSLLSLARDTLPSIAYVTNLLFAPDSSSTPWALSVGDDPAALRAAVRSDIDSDGLEELAIVYRTLDQGVVELKIYEDSVEKFSEGQTLVISTDPVNDLVISSGDYNGDGYAELVIGLIYNDSIRLLFVDNAFGNLSLSTVSKNLPQAISGSEISLVIESGNLDYDPSIEFVVIVNEIFQQAVNAHYFVFDDGKNNYAEIADGPVRANESNTTASVGDVSLGDIDGDNIDEIVIAGLVHFDPSGTCNYSYVTVVLDDLIRNLAQLAEKVEQPDIHGGCASGVEKGELQFVHVNTPDLEGDGIPEIQVNGVVYGYGGGNLVPFSDKYGTPVSIPDCSLFGSEPKFTKDVIPVPLDCEDDNLDGSLSTDPLNLGFTGGRFTGRFSARNSAMVAADLTSDKKEDIILYSQSTHRLEVWGLSDSGTEGIVDKVETDSWRMLDSIALEPLDPPGNDIRPILVPVNVNHDTLAISLDDGEHKVVFTEPIIIAALAAAPCYDNLGQDIGACRTTYGTAESDSTESDNVVTTTASLSVGWKSVEGAGVGVTTSVAMSAVFGTLKGQWSRIRSRAYTYTESVKYQTGPIEDTVIFTSIPYDVYTYAIISHPDSNLIGNKIDVSMPRNLVTLQVERGFYNANVFHDGPKIDSSVFTHNTGDPNSYPIVGAKKALLERYSEIVEKEPGDLRLPNKVRWAYDFDSTAAVGQGGGTTTQSINISTESGEGNSVGAGFDFTVEGTITKAFVGFTIGVDDTATFIVKHGKESSYEGTVSNFPADEFATNPYSWGLFTYLMDDHPSGQQFEVINYWVE